MTQFVKKKINRHEKFNNYINYLINLFSNEFSEIFIKFK